MSLRAKQSQEGPGNPGSYIDAAAATAYGCCYCYFGWLLPLLSVYVPSLRAPASCLLACWPATATVYFGLCLPSLVAVNGPSRLGDRRETPGPRLAPVVVVVSRRPRRMDPLALETERLAFDTVFFVLGRRPSKARDETAQCLRRSVKRMLERHALVFNSMVSRLHVTQDSDLNAGFRELSNELFVHNEVSWSKIIALFAFGARLAQHCEESNLGNLVFDVATNLAQYAVEKLTPFLKQHGGWTTLCDAFPTESDYETKIWLSLVFTGLGLTAIATFLALQH